MTRLRRRLAAGGAFSLVAHLGLLVAIVSLAPGAPVRPLVEPEPIEIALAPPIPPPEPPKPPEPEDKPVPKPAPAKAPRKAVAPKPAPARAPPRLRVRQARAPRPDVAPLEVATGPPADGVSDAELASAATAGSGGSGGGTCDMAAWLQSRLRHDRDVIAALAPLRGGRAVRLWKNGAWVPHAGQDGAGLAAVREAIIWEVAFAPAECRTRPVRGLVLLTLGDDGRAPRVVLGASAWRWSDLLFAKGARG